MLNPGLINQERGRTRTKTVDRYSRSSSAAINRRSGRSHIVCCVPLCVPQDALLGRGSFQVQEAQRPDYTPFVSPRHKVLEHPSSLRTLFAVPSVPSRQRENFRCSSLHSGCVLQRLQRTQTLASLLAAQSASGLASSSSLQLFLLHRSSCAADRAGCPDLPGTRIPQHPSQAEGQRAQPPTA